MRIGKEGKRNRLILKKDILEAIYLHKNLVTNKVITKANIKHTIYKDVVLELAENQHITITKKFSIGNKLPYSCKHNITDSGKELLEKIKNAQALLDYIGGK